MEPIYVNKEVHEEFLYLRSRCNVTGPIKKEILEHVKKYFSEFIMNTTGPGGPSNGTIISKFNAKIDDEVTKLVDSLWGEQTQFPTIYALNICNSFIKVALNVGMVTDYIYGFAMKNLCDHLIYLTSKDIGLSLERIDIILDRTVLEPRS